MRLQDRVIVLTGNAGLLGSVIHIDLENNGAKVIGLDIKQKEPNLTNLVCDITNEEDVQSTVNNIIAKYGKIDGWVNNAYPRTSDWATNVEEVLYDSWRKNVDMHMNSYFLCSRIALNAMKPNKKGSLINIASIYGIQGPDFSIYEGTKIENPVGYSAIKGGIINLTRYLASYYGRYNLRANCVSPGGIFDGQDPVFVSNYEKKVPLKRMGTPDDIAPMISFLLSEDASYISGQNIAIDGGWCII